MVLFIFKTPNEHYYIARLLRLEISANKQCVIRPEIVANKHCTRHEIAANKHYEA